MVLLASSYDESKYFKAADLADEIRLKIKSVTEEKIGLGAEQEVKLVVWFTNDKHGLVLNRVNNRTIRGAFGDDTEAWEKKIIVIFPTMVDMRGKLTPALRVRIPPTQQTAATAPADPELEDDPPKSLAEDLDDEIPFESRTADR